VLPEIVGKWYTRKLVTDDSGTVQTTSKIQDEDDCEDEDDDDESSLWCYCEKRSSGQMVMCDNKNALSDGFILNVYE